MKHLYRSILPVLLLAGMYQANAQSYCKPSYTGHGNQFTGVANVADAFFTHIRNVKFSDINHTTAAPNYYGTVAYKDYTYDTGYVARGATYTLSIWLGNGANPQMCVVWIDYNQNKVFEVSERIFNAFDPANQGTHIVGGNITIPAGAKLGTTMMRVATKLGNTIADPCVNNDPNASTNNWSQDFHDYTIEVQNAATQSFVSSTTRRPVTDEVTIASTDNLIMGIEVTTNSNGVLSPLTAGDFTFNTLGTTNPTELAAAKLYYTGQNPGFNIITQVGSTVNNPSGTFTINANTKLKAGTNYFWLVYDIAGAGVIGNDISSRCTRMQVSGIDRYPRVVNPPGVRKIGYCISKGSQMNFIGVWNVQMGSIQNNTFYQQFSPYTFYSYLRDTLERGSTDTITVQIGNGINASKLKVWIDFNRDGDFTDAGEQIVDSFNFLNNQATTNYPFIKKGFSVPANAVVGPTRMRVSTQQYGSAKAFTSCTNPTDIGEVEDYSVIISSPGEPVADFKASISCVGVATDFYDASYTFDTFTINSWDWDFGEPASASNTSTQQDPSHTYAKGGVFNVKLTVNSNKSGSTPQTITKAVLVEEPLADFSFYPPVFQIPVNFYDNSSGGYIMAWYWDFGDQQSGANNYSGAANPQHVFDTAGTYTVTLVVTTSGGCQDTVTKQVTILQHQVPIADFTSTTFDPYVGAATTITDQSVNSPSAWKWTITPAKYKWLNNTNDSSQNPEVSFDSLTTYTVFLEAKNPAGSHTTSKTFTTKNYTAPKAWLGATPTVARIGEQISYTDSSDNDPTAWEWQFGDTSGVVQSTLQFPTHSYSKAGKYSVTLKASNPGGADSVMRYQYITVTNGFNMCDNTATSTTTTAGLIYDSGGPNGNYSDGSNCGFLIKPNCSGKIVISFTKMDMQANDLVQVFDGEDDITGKPLHSGNGFTGNALPGTFVCNSGAVYIKEISDGTGNSSGFALSWTAFANQVPNPRILNDSVWYVNSPLHLKNGTAQGAGNHYAWDFENDGNVDDTTESPTTLYPVQGKVTIRLDAWNCIGKDSVLFNLNVKLPTQVPVANFVADRDTVLPIDEIQLTDLSTNGASAWLWEFIPAGHEFYPLGDNEFTQSPRIGFVDEGNYTVCLTSTNQVGSSQRVCKTNYIVVKGKSQMCVFPYSSSVAAGKFVDEGDLNNDYSANQNCDLLINPCATEVYLAFKSFDLGGGDYLRIYDGTDNKGIPLFSGSGYTGSVVPGPFTAYSGSFYFEFTSDASQQGKGWEADWTSKAPQAANASFTSPTTVYASGFNYFTNTSQGNNLSYEWYVDGNPVANTTHLDYRSFTAGTHFVWLIATNCLGSDTATYTFTAVAATAKPAVAFTVNVQNPDTGQIVTFTDASTNGPTAWAWEIVPSAGVTWLNGDTLPYPIVQFADTGWYEVCLTAANSQGNDKLCQTNYIHVVGYCRPAPGTSQSVGITKVILNNFSNNTPIDGGYTDYTSQGSITTLERKASYSISLEKNVSGVNQNWRAWIDWNRDGDFTDAGEQVLSQPATSNVSVTSSFKVPGNIALGQVRLRVSASFNTNANQPCFVGFGDVEDYLVNIGDDKTKPVITLIGSNPDFLEQGYTYTDPGATAQDNVDGNITPSIVSSNTINNLVLGTYQVKYNVSDSAGNKADEVVRDVEVTADVTPPVIVLTGKDTETVEVFDQYVEKGYTASDLVDGNRTGSVVTTGMVDISKLGLYMLTYTATDTKGNIGSKVRYVKIVDTQKPVINLLGADTETAYFGQVWTDPGTTVTDNYYQGLAATVSGSVNTNLKGFYTLTYSAQDSSGNKAADRKRVVKVEYAAGVGQVLTADNISLYPNPAKQQAFVLVNLPDEMKQHVRFRMLNSLGQCVQAAGFERMQGSVFTLNLNELATGVYLVMVENGNESLTLRFIKE